MLRVARSAKPDETGGTLVGVYEDGNRIARIERVIAANQSATRQRYKFVRPSDYEDRQLGKIYQQSKGRLLYLGEWHSHPGGPAMPSGTDIATMVSLARDTKVAANTPILIVLGGDLKTKANITCSVVDYTGAHFIGSIAPSSHG